MFLVMLKRNDVPARQLQFETAHLFYYDIPDKTLLTQMIFEPGPHASAVAITIGTYNNTARGIIALQIRDLESNTLIGAREVDLAEAEDNSPLFVHLLPSQTSAQRRLQLSISCLHSDGHPFCTIYAQADDNNEQALSIGDNTRDTMRPFRITWRQDWFGYGAHNTGKASAVTALDLTVPFFGHPSRLVYFFDEEWYRRTNKLDETVDAFDYFLTTGQYRDHSPHPFFDPAYYRDTNAVEHGRLSLEHFLRVGLRLGRSPHVLFDTEWYHETNAVPEEFRLGVLHYMAAGEAGGLSPHPLFDVKWFSSRYRRYLPEGSSALRLFLTSDAPNAFDPHPLFSSAYYISQNFDVWYSRSQAIEHFIAHGMGELRDPHPAFSSRTCYEQSDPRILKAERTLLGYEKARNKQGFAVHPDFSNDWYLERWSRRLSKDSTSPLRHFVEAGVYDFLQCHPDKQKSNKFHLRVREFNASSTITRVNEHSGPILIVCHTLGGGTELFVRELTSLLTRQGCPHATLFYSVNEPLAVYTDIDNKKYMLNIDLFEDRVAVESLIISRGIKLVHYNQVLGSGSYVSNLAASLNIPYVVTVHDYYWVCPRVNMVDATGRFCGGPTIKGCQRCVQLAGPFPGIEDEYSSAGGTIMHWLNKTKRFLQNARRVIAPSEDTAQRIEKILEVDVVVRTHLLPPFPFKLTPPSASKAIRGTGHRRD